MGAVTSALEASRQDPLEGSADAHPEISVLLAFVGGRRRGGVAGIGPFGA